MAMREELAQFQQSIAYTFRDEGLLKELFVHRSFLNERGGAGLRSNERLEFLGDAVLSTVISHIMMERFPDKNEGDLSMLRARLVSEVTLASLARKMGLGNYLLLGKGELLDGGRKKSSLLADTFEALIAAIYLDGGFAAAFDFIAKRFDTMLDGLSTETKSRDYKTLLQEYTQGHFKAVPKYTVVDESGRDHERTFTVHVLISGKVCGEGKGRSKKEAHQRAAQEALARYEK
ncbi:MAG: ribonuclease III [Thermodesulfobacteriota bacterium]